MTVAFQPDDFAGAPLPAWREEALAEEEHFDDAASEATYYSDRDSFLGRPMVVTDADRAKLDAIEPPEVAPRPYFNGGPRRLEVVPLPPPGIFTNADIDAALEPDPDASEDALWTGYGAGETVRTLADISDDAPGPLLLDMLEPDGPTLAYGAPGTGKGMTGAWMCVELQRAGMLPLIFDAEARPREWARRVGGLGGDRSRVAYVQPVDLGPKYAGRPLWESSEALREAVRSCGADLIIIDSILPATGLGEDRLRSDAQPPFLYVAALDALRIPSLSFGHPPKGQPEGEPFGSFAWTAAMRLTWLGTRAEGERHGIRWRPRKRNERGYIPGVLLTFAYALDGRPCAVTREDDEESTREWLLAALVRGPRSVADMAEELLEETDEHVTDDARQRVKERLSKALRRLSIDGTVVKEGAATGRNVRWSLRWETPR